MKKRKKEEFDYAEFEREAISKLRSGKGLTGEGGALTELIGRIVTAAFEGEMEDHLSSEEEPGNRGSILNSVDTLFRILPDPEI